MNEEEIIREQQRNRDKLPYPATKEDAQNTARLDASVDTSKKKKPARRVSNSSVSDSDENLDECSFISEKDIRKAVGMAVMQTNDIDLEFKQNHRELFKNELIPKKKDTKLKLHVKHSAKEVIAGLGNLKTYATDADGYDEI